jgi:hypothetical protein
MSDLPQTPEAVAYQLLKDVITIEHGPASTGATSKLNRQWLFDTYGECLKAVRAEIVKPGPTHGRSSF